MCQSGILVFREVEGDTPSPRGVGGHFPAAARFERAIESSLCVPVHIVAARLGDTPQTVLGTYAHLLPQSDEIAAERVAAALAR
jgi:hypothetical protein